MAALLKVGDEHELSLEISIVLMITYALSLLFSLRTHKHLYVGDVQEHGDEAMGTHGWSRGKSVAVLLGATVLVAVMSEFLVGAVDVAAASTTERVCCAVLKLRE